VPMVPFVTIAAARGRAVMNTSSPDASFRSGPNRQPTSTDAYRFASFIMVDPAGFLLPPAVKATAIATVMYNGRAWDSRHKQNK
jgi:hypothetical protein